MYILKIGIIGSSFENKDFGIEIFGEATCYHAARCAAADGQLLVDALS